MTVLHCPMEALIYYLNIFVLLVFIQSSAAVTVTHDRSLISDRGSLLDQPCAPGQPVCQVSQGAYCSTERTCLCGDGLVGHGNLDCLNENQSVCIIGNDPRLVTYGQESVDIPYPCPYLASHVIVRREDQPTGTYIHECRTEVYVTHVRANGKQFVQGFEVKMKMKGYRVSVELKAGAIGQVLPDGHYTYDMFVAYTTREGDSLVPIGENLLEMNIAGDTFGQMKFWENTGKMRVELAVDFCGLDLSFRAADLTRGKDQIWMPGILIAYDTEPTTENAYNTIEYLSDRAMCLTPYLDETNVRQISMEAKLPPDQAFLLRAMNGAKDLPTLNLYESETGRSQCQAMFDVDHCHSGSLQQRALGVCSFMLESPPFVNCYSRASEEDNGSLVAVQSLFGDCVQAYCTQNTILCDWVHRQVKQTECDRFGHRAFEEQDCIFSLINSIM